MISTKAHYGGEYVQELMNARKAQVLLVCNRYSSTFIAPHQKHNVEKQKERRNESLPY